MIHYFQYLTQLDLIKSILNKNKENSRIAIILMDNCIELVLTNYISQNCGNEILPYDFSKKLEIAKIHKIIDAEMQSVFLLYHHYRNILQHTGDSKSDYIYNNLEFYFNKIVDTITNIDNKRFSYEMRNKEYKALFEKYNSKPYTDSYNYIKDTFTKLKFVCEKSDIRNNLKNMLKELIDSWNEQSSMAYGVSKFQNTSECLVYCFKNHYKKENKDYISKFEKYIKTVDKINLEFNKIDTTQNSFFNDVLQLETKVLFLLDLTYPAFCYINSQIDMQIDRIRLGED
ncbi:MAG: hypothetical protein PHR26_03480 [Candidatus ainarchaeum sp.]|nr:hypothetical protein [Candidatus ainarchaeum sp.]MDD3976431.1 hypothetical protein [Candidatus ainarchaeum sp.]